jgi:tRNA G37 N-methylase TrmD
MTRAFTVIDAGNHSRIKNARKQTSLKRNEKKRKNAINAVKREPVINVTINPRRKKRKRKRKRNVNLRNAAKSINATKMEG